MMTAEENLMKICGEKDFRIAQLLTELQKAQAQLTELQRKKTKTAEIHELKKAQT